jgi:O-antigen ligase
MKLEHLLAAAAIMAFLGMLVFYQTSKRAYILSVLYLLPIMDLAITPVEWGRLKVFDIISYIICIVFFKDFLLKKERHRYNTYYLLFAALVVCVFLGCLNSQFLKNSLLSFLSLFPIFIYTKALLIECWLDEGFQIKVIKNLKLSVAISIAFLAIQMVLGLKFTFYEALNRNTIMYGDPRYPSFFHDPQKYGQFLVMLGFLFLLDFSKPDKPGWKNYAMFILVIIALIKTGGRTALFGIFAGMVILAFKMGARYRIAFISIALAGSVLMIFYSDTFVVFGRAKELNADYYFRAALWEEAIGWFSSNPIFGVGIGNYGNYAATFSSNYYIDVDKNVIFFDQPESGYLMILTELGLTGMFTFCLLILTPIYNSIVGYIKGNKNMPIFFIIAGLIGWMVTFASVYSISDKRILIALITLLALLIAEREKSYKLYS